TKGISRCVRCATAALNRPATPFEVKFAADSPLEGRVSCELVSENAKFPASWEYTGNFIDSGLGGASRVAKNDIKSVPYGPIPKHPNREFFAALQGIKSGDQGNFRPDQGIPLSTAISAAALATNRIVPTDLERCREAGTGTPPDARGRRSRSPARGRLCPSERRARHAQNRSPSLSTRTIGVPGLHDGAWSRRARPGCTELTAYGVPMVRIHLPPAASPVR